MTVAGRIATELAAAPAFGAVRRSLRSEDAWVVGGALRDAALGRPVTDVDLAVGAGAEEAAARAVAAQIDGHAFSLSDRFAAWRAMPADGSWRVDVAALRGDDIHADLRLRDLTVNAMALPLGGGAGELVDPLAGLADLEAEVLRAAGDEAFADDPLRIMRLARLGAELGFAVEPRTVELARRTAPRAAEPAGERQFAELRGLMVGPHPLRGLELLDEVGAIPVVLPELEGLRGVTQTPYHHLDAHGHSLEVLERYVDLQADLSEVLGGPLAEQVATELESELADEMTRGDSLRFAALLHDVAKPATRAVSDEGRVTFFGHDHLGAQMVKEICARLRTSRRFAEFVAHATLNHLRLGFLVHGQPLSRRIVFDYLRATEPYGVDVTVLTVADRLATHGGRTKPEAIEAHLELARQMLTEVLEWERSGPPVMPIKGDELAAELGMDRGPELGRLLTEVEAGVFAGEVSSRADAVRLAAAVAESGSA